jgi:hypothetical protein
MDFSGEPWPLYLAARRWAHPGMAGGVWRFDGFRYFFGRKFVQFAILQFS